MVLQLTPAESFSFQPLNTQWLPFQIDTHLLPLLCYEGSSPVPPPLNKLDSLESLLQSLRHSSISFAKIMQIWGSGKRQCREGTESVATTPETIVTLPTTHQLCTVEDQPRLNYKVPKVNIFSLAGIIFKWGLTCICYLMITEHLKKLTDEEEDEELLLFLIVGLSITLNMYITYKIFPSVNIPQLVPIFFQNLPQSHSFQYTLWHERRSCSL